MDCPPNAARGSLARKSRAAIARIAFGLVLLLGLTAGASAARYAVLIGVSEYPFLDPRASLTGPRNDVPLLRGLLEQKGFPAADIRVLADGVDRGEAPTRANIVGALEGLAAKARAGDYVFLHFSGHGAQQPAPDGEALIQIFLPRDAQGWDQEQSAVANAIAGHELRRLVEAIRRQGAFVWASFDTCQSASIIRGADDGDARPRGLSAAALGIPAAAFAGAGKRGTTSERREPEESPLLGPGAAAGSAGGGLIAVYAARSNEAAHESTMPAKGKDRKSYGELTYTLVDVLQNSEGVSYRQLGQQILQRYALRRAKSTPLLEGSALDAPVFQQRAGALIRQWPLAAASEGWTIPAGELDQLAVGAVFEVLATPIAGSEQRLGYVRADSVHSLSSRLTPIAEAGLAPPLPETIPAGAYARLVATSVGFGLTVAMPATSPNEGARELAARRLLAELVRRPDLARMSWVAPDAAADVRLIFADQKIWLTPAAGSPIKEGAQRTPSLPLDRADAGFAEALAAKLKGIARVRNLIKIAGLTGGAPAMLDLRGEIVRPGQPPQGLDPAAAMPRLKDGDTVRLHMENLSEGMVDVTVLYLDSDYGIDAVYPSEAAHVGRIERDGRDSVDIPIGDATTGIERVLVIAVEGKKYATEAANFTYLAQPRLAATRAGASPLAALLQDAVFTETGKRSALAAADVLQALQMRVLSWEVVK